MKSSAKPESGPECSVPATGCAGHEMRGRRQMRRHVPDDRALDRADVGDDRARRKMSADLLGDRTAGADGNAEDDEVGVLDRFGIGLDHGIDDAELSDPRAASSPNARW